MKKLTAIYLFILLFCSFSYGDNEMDRFKHSVLSNRRNRNNLPITSAYSIPRIHTYDWQPPTAREIAPIMGIIKDDFLVNDDVTGGAFQQYSSVAMDGSGNFVIAWEDWCNDYGDIYYQQYDASEWHREGISKSMMISE